MECKQAEARLPVDFEGDHLNVLIDGAGKVWVCIDGVSVFRARGLKVVTVEDHRTPEDIVKEKRILRRLYGT